VGVRGLGPPGKHCGPTAQPIEGRQAWLAASAPADRAGQTAARFVAAQPSHRGPGGRPSV